MTPQIVSPVAISYTRRREVFQDQTVRHPADVAVDTSLAIIVFILSALLEFGVIPL